MTKDILYILFAQGTFILSGYVLHIFVGRSLGPDLYGIFGIITSFYFIFERLLGGSISKGLSKFVAENGQAARSIINFAIKIQIFLSIVILLVFYAGASLIANLMRDLNLTAYLQILSFLIIISGFYILYSAILNGLRAFYKQAIVTVVFAFARILFVVLLVIAGFSIKGAIWGLVLAGIACLWLSWHYCKPLTGKDKFDKKALIGFSFKVLSFTFGIQLIMNIDLIFVKIILKDGLSTGLYTAITNLARIPMLIVLPVSIVIFPYIVKAISDNETGLANNYINRILRYLVLFLVPFSLMVSGTSKEIISLIYGDMYSGAATGLSILIFGLTFIAISIIMNTIILAVCDLTIFLLFNIFLTLLDAALNFLLINNFGLPGAAIATTVSGFIGCIFSIVYVFSYFPFTIKWKSFFNIISSSLIIYLLSIKFSFSGIYLLVTYLILYGIYFSILLVLKEIDSKDFNTLKNITFIKPIISKKTA